MIAGSADLKEVALNLGDAIAKLLSLQADLFRVLGDADGIQATLVELFSEPVPLSVSLSPEPWQKVASRVQLGFEHGAKVTWMVAPKLYHSLSPDSCLNTLTIGYGGGSPYICLAAWASWADFETAERYQLGFYALPDRPLSCQAVLRLPQEGGGDRDAQFCSFDLRPGERAHNATGPLSLPDDLQFDRQRPPMLLLLFDSQAPFEMQIDYVSLYFA